MSLSSEPAAHASEAAAAGNLPGEPLRRARPLLGTIVSIRVRGIEPAQARAAIDAGFAAIAAVHRLMSFHEADSDVSRLNREALARAVEVDARTMTVLQRALDFAALSNGAFDLTVAHQLVEFGLLPRPRGAPVPDPAACWRDIELRSDQRVRFHRPLWIDLGGIAKGYAVDHAVACMALAPQAQLCINAGGDLRVCGPEVETVYLKVSIPQPTVPLIRLQDGSLASSSGRGVYRMHGKRRVGPHVHGVRRAPMGLRSFVSVVAPECLVADALTKIVLAQGLSSEPVLRQFDATAHVHDDRHGWRTLGTAA